MVGFSTGIMFRRPIPATVTTISPLWLGFLPSKDKLVLARTYKLAIGFHAGYLYSYFLKSTAPCQKILGSVSVGSWPLSGNVFFVRSGGYNRNT